MHVQSTRLVYIFITMVAISSMLIVIAQPRNLGQDENQQEYSVYYVEFIPAHKNGYAILIVLGPPTDGKGRFYTPETIIPKNMTHIVAVTIETVGPAQPLPEFEKTLETNIPPIKP